MRWSFRTPNSQNDLPGSYTEPGKSRCLDHKAIGIRCRLDYNEEGPPTGRPFSHCSVAGPYCTLRRCVVVLPFTVMFTW